LIRWSPTGNETLITTTNQPIDRFVHLSSLNSIIFATSDGALWYTDRDRQTTPLGGPGPRVNRIVARSDERIVYCGYADGNVVAVDTGSRRFATVLRAAGAIGEISLTPDDRTISIATNDGLIHVAELPGGLAFDKTTWVKLAARARHQALAPDGLLVVLTPEGTIWLYSTSQRRWLCLPTGPADLRRVAISRNGDTAVALDVEGRLIWIDLDIARSVMGVETELKME
jgi:hypothetical protein